MKPKKSDLVRQYVSEGRYKEALRIAKGFVMGISKEESKLMARAYECMVHPEFYSQIGVIPDLAIEKGLIVLKRIYG